MASIQFTSKDIFDKDFKTAVRGYNKEEVDEFLDDVIKDYETYAALVKELQQEIQELKKKVAKPSPQEPVQPRVQAQAPVQPTYTQTALPKEQAVSVSNYDILRRLNRLEKEVFGKQIVEKGL
ncbi:cell division regulator GpsB [Streptococcus sp. NLN76]|uniref:cell division regulator GpsB n=1 Tax=Streptococcus sp. NLN76 TaxID=2822800 RepID=UPI0018AA87DE|nr:cell division regulator GpsB [Streptococcus sp. NLN76]MBF8970047.1 cell division regulator GpsB [Streptococcus sp. NLN76]